MLNGNSQNILLKTFRDNKTRDITAADMREFVNAAYAELLLRDDVEDSVLSLDPDKAFSAKQGTLLAKRVQELQDKVDDLERKLSDLIKILTGDDGDVMGGVTGEFKNFPTTLYIKNGLIKQVQ